MKAQDYAPLLPEHLAASRLLYYFVCEEAAWEGAQFAHARKLDDAMITLTARPTHNDSTRGEKPHTEEK